MLGTHQPSRGQKVPARQTRPKRSEAKFQANHGKSDPGVCEFKKSMRVARNPLRPAARESERGERRIFIQIPAYRDSELGATVRDLLRKARYPESLRIAILWQRGPNEELDLGFARGAELEVTEISHTNSRGCNWARAQLQQQWRGERFTLILDSHHRFAVGWDQKLLDAYDALVRRGVEKPIVTAYLPPYNPLTDPRGRRKRPLKIYPYERSQGLLLRLIGRPILTAQQSDWTNSRRFCLFALSLRRRRVQSRSSVRSKLLFLRRRSRHKPARFHAWI